MDYLRSFFSLHKFFWFSLPFLVLATCYTHNIQKISADVIYSHGIFDQYENDVDLDSNWAKQGDVRWMEEKGDKFIRLVNLHGGHTAIKSSLSLDSAWRRIKISGSIRIPELTPLPQFGKTARLFTAFYSNDGDLLSFTGDISPNHVTWRNPIEDWQPFEFSFNLPLYVDEGSSKGSNQMQFQFELNEAAGTLDINDFKLEVIEEKQVVSGAIFNNKLVSSIHAEKIFGSIISPKDEGKIKKVLHVNPLHNSANDSNTGSKEAPLKTLKKALALFEQENQPCKIILHKGKYYEENHLSIPENGKKQPLLVIEAPKKGEAIITGAEVFTEWQPTSETGVYEHKWLHKFGVTGQIWAGNGPWGNSGFIGEKGMRKEMLFVDNKPYRQVFDKEQLTEKTFYIDEGSGAVFINLPENQLIEQVQIEVATKGDFFNVSNKENLVLRNLVFEKAAKFIPFGSVEFSFCKNILIENCDFVYSNATGLLFNFAENITLDRVNASYNGWNGYKFEFAKQVITKNCETSYNNWRGNMAGINGWDLAGNKNFNVHCFLIENHKAYDNRGEGIWFDWCCQNIKIKDGDIIGNHSTGVYWEANQGPSMIKNCRIAHNGQSGVRNAEAWNLCLMNNQIYDNYESQLEIRARLRSGVDKYSAPNYLFTSLYLTTQDNVFSSEIHNSHLIELYSMRDSSITIYNDFLESYHGSNNTFFHTLSDTAFSFERHRYVDMSKYNRWERGGRKSLQHWEGMTSEYHPVWKDSSLARIHISGIAQGESIASNKEHLINISSNSPMEKVHAGYIKLEEGRDVHKYFLADITEIPLENEEATFKLKETGEYAVLAYGFTESGSLIVSPKINIEVKNMSF